MLDEINTDEDGYFMEGVAFKAPGRTEELVKDLHLHLKPGESLLITGSSSAGKTSLLRLLRGLWRVSRGNLTAHYTPGPCGVLFLPQKPYLTDGTLREQVVPTTCCSFVTLFSFRYSANNLIELDYVPIERRYGSYY
jgi:ATP-binding cassette subfamily D (ALD) protein 4